MMVPAKSNQANVAARAARKAKAEEEARRAAEELRIQRTRQLESAKLAIDNLEQSFRTNRTKATRREALFSHLNGFYEEIDKLAKGKTLLEVTDLVVEQANDIVRDAKAIVQGDVYLDRVKEFVPAGTNPVYPDVLLVIRAIQQCLARFESQLSDRRDRLGKLLNEARTIVTALQCYFDADESEVAKKDVEEILGGKADGKWFGDYNEGFLFDFDRLDRTPLETYLSNSSDGRTDE